MTDSSPMEACPKCGARQRDPEARFCQFCGELMPAAAASRRRKMIFGSAGLVLTILVVVLVIRIIGKGAPGSRGAQQAAMGDRSRSVTLALPTQGDLPTASSTVPRAPVAATVGPTLAPTAVMATLAPEQPTAPPEPTEAPSPMSATPPNGYIDRPSGTLELRSGPDMGYAPIIGARNGAMLEIVGRTATGDWLLVRTGDGVGGWLPTLFVHTNSSLAAVPIIAAARPTRGRPSPTITRTPQPPSPTPRAGPNPRFRTDKASIRGGDCATLRWDVENVRAVYLDGNPQGGHGVIIVCPPASHTFVLTLVLPDGERVDWPLEITVTGTGAPPQFLIEHPGCLPHELSLGQVKGRVFDRTGRIVVGALVEILVEGQPGIVPVGHTNEEGWYEFNLRSGHDATFVRLEIEGRSMSVYPEGYTVTARSRCYQQVDFRQR